MLLDAKELDKRSPEGVGGWLILLLLTIWINAAARLAVGLPVLAALFHVPRASAYASSMEPAPAAVAVAAGLFGAVVGFLLARKNPRAPALAKTLLALNAGFYLLYLLAPAFHTGPIAAEPIPAWLKPGAWLTVSIVALVYLLRSRRVANTYARRPDGPDPAEVFYSEEDSDVIRNRIFPFEEFRGAEPAAAAAAGAHAAEVVTPVPGAHETAAQPSGELQTPVHQSGLFRDQTLELMPPGDGAPGEDGRGAGIPRSEPLNIDPRNPQEVWPARRFEPGPPGALDPEGGRIFHDEITGSGQPAPVLHPVEIHGPLPPAAQRPDPRTPALRTTDLLRPEAAPTKSFTPEAAEPATHRSRIFSREAMVPRDAPVPRDAIGPERLVPAARIEEPHPTVEPEPVPSAIDPLAREAWPKGTFVPDPPPPPRTDAPIDSRMSNGHRASARELESQEWSVLVQDAPDHEPQELSPQPAEPLAQLGSESKPQRLPVQPSAPQLARPAEPDPRELDALKAQIAAGVTQWLAATVNDSGRPNSGAALLDEAGNPLPLEQARQKLLDQVDAICDQAWSVCVGQSPTLPNTPDSGGSVTDELQKWAIAQAAFRLTRSFDIRAAMEVNGPFERVANDREYLMAVASKNSSEDAFGRKVDLADFDDYPGPEIAYRLILRAQRDMFEADMWAHVAGLAGDPDFRNRLSSRGSKSFQESREYWSGYASSLHRERAPFTAPGTSLR